MTALPSTVIWLDRDQRIMDVNPHWDAFALANGGAACVSEKVRGRRLMDFICGDETRMWVDATLMLARVRGEPVERPYRCDAPNLRRFMQMRVSPEGEGVLKIEHLLIRAEPRERPIDIRGNNTHETACLQCSICGFFRRRDDWIEPEAVAEKENWPSVLTVNYSVCDYCAQNSP